MTVAIYKIKSDYTGHALTPVDPTLWSDGKVFRLERMRANWKKHIFYVHDPVQTKDTDFYRVRVGTIAFGRRVRESTLGEILERCGEVLPAIRQDTREEFYILNPLACYNCLDREQTILRTTPDRKVVVQIHDYVFYPERIGGESVFKIPETYLTELFASSGRVGLGDDFFHQYREGSFTGLKFDRVWEEH